MIIYLSLLGIGSLIILAANVYKGIADMKTETERNNRWMPTRNLVLNEAGNTYGALIYVAMSIVRPSGLAKPTDLPSQIHYESFIVMIKRADNSLSNLKELIKLNNGALDSELLPKLATFVQTADKLRALLSYFGEFQNQQWKDYDFVSEGPQEQISHLTAIVEEMHGLYPDALVRGKDIPDNLLSPEDLRKEWLELEGACRRIHLNPAEYKWHDRTPIIVFNPANMRKLKAPTNEHAKNVVHLLYGYQ